MLVSIHEPLKQAGESSLVFEMAFESYIAVPANYAYAVALRCLLTSIQMAAIAMKLYFFRFGQFVNTHASVITKTALGTFIQRERIAWRLHVL